MPFRKSAVDKSQRSMAPKTATASAPLVIPSTKSIEAWISVADLLLAQTLDKEGQRDA